MISFGYRTAKGNVYPLTLQYRTITVSDLVFQPETVQRYCREGCKNFGRAGGCPPRAPLLDQLYPDEKLCWLIICKFNSVYKPEKVFQSKNSAIHWKFQDGILARVMNSLGHALRDTVGGRFLSTGYCMGCPGKKCLFKLGEERCRHPEKRTFSMEATGIHVVDTVKTVFGQEFFWYQKGLTTIPYMMKCIAFFPDDQCVEASSVLQILRALPIYTKS